MVLHLHQKSRRCNILFQLKNRQFETKFGKIRSMERLIKLISKLPLGFVRGVGRFISVLIYRCSESYRHQIRENLMRAGVYTPELALSVAKEQGAQGVEAPWVWGRDREDILELTHCDEESKRIVQETFAMGKPIVFLTPHIGCYEVAPIYIAHHWLGALNKNMAILYRVPKKSYLRSIVGQGRAIPNILPSSADLKGVRQILKTMKAGGLAGILPDQVPSEGEGIWVPLFGQYAYTMTFPVRLARQFDANVLMCRVQREENGWSVHMRRWDYTFTGDDSLDCAAMNRLVEETILECPEQYLWSYNRYKCPKGATPPPKN